MEGTNRLTDAQFPRPYGVERAERLRITEAFVMDEPTLAEALDMNWNGGRAFGAATFARLVVAAADAQRALSAALQAPTVDRDEALRCWRAMRAAQLVLACRATQKLGGPIYA